LEGSGASAPTGVGASPRPGPSYAPAVADQQPTRATDDERSTLLGLLQFQRESFVRKVDGVSDDDARRSPVPSGTSLLWLAKHLSRAEQIWLQHRFTGQVGIDEIFDHDVGPDDTLEAAIERYRTTWVVSDGIVAAASLDDRAVLEPPGDEVNLRWILGHLLEETARHAGHADILRELIDGDTGR
jgi:hypothetical protein